jgi:hypothetical protein
MEPLAVLDGVPIVEGDILYSLDGAALRVLKPWRTDMPLRMESVAKKKPGDADYWATDTHWKGQQVLFWRVSDIPVPKDRSLYFRLKDQLDARAARRKLRARRRDA